MKVLPQWDAIPLLGSRTYSDLMASPPPAIETIVPPRLDQINDVITERRRFADRSIDRLRMVQGLRESHERRSAPVSSLKHIDALIEPDTFLITTGQQPGLLGGPLYTIYKILHAIALARRLTGETNARFFPAFWNASEDSDLSEISTLWILDKEGFPVSYTWPRESSGSQPYYTIPARECPIDDVIAFLREHSRPTEFSDDILSNISNCAARAQHYPDFFDALLWSLFHDDGLIIIRPDDPYVRKSARPLIEREIRQPHLAAEEIEQTGQSLRALGLTPQIQKRPDRTAFFLVENEERIPLYITQDDFQDKQGKTYSKDDCLSRLERSPESFSPSAILRPVIQDALFPTAGVVLGPSELAYHFLLDPLYTRHDVPRPCVVPRFGLTLLESRMLKTLNKNDLTPLELNADPNALMKEIIQKRGEADFTNAHQRAENCAIDLFDQLKVKAQQVDPSILKVLDKNLTKIRQEMGNSEALLLRRIAAKNDILHRQIESLHHSLYPDGALQERRLNVFYYLLKYGPEFLVAMMGVSLTMGQRTHSYLSIP